MKTPKQHSPARLRHMAALRTLSKSKTSGESLWLRLRRVEKRMERAATEACNTQAGVDALPKAILDAKLEVFGIMGSLPTGFFINTDPRGYALKIDNDKVPEEIEGLHRDFGGYYILAPEF